jgi:hypothetical protein
VFIDILNRGWSGFHSTSWHQLLGSFIGTRN